MADNLSHRERVQQWADAYGDMRASPTVHDEVHVAGAWAHRLDDGSWPTLRHSDICALLADQSSGDGDVADPFAPEYLREMLDQQTARLEGARAALATCADRMDEHTYDEIATHLDDDAFDGWGRTYVSEREALRADRDRLAALLAEARNAFDEVTGDYQKELVAEDPWYIAAAAALSEDGEDQP